MKYLNVKNKSLQLIILFISIGSNFISAQNKPTNLEEKIDSLFNRYNDGLSPGIAVGIMYNDEILLAKGYGFANLEHRISITDSTAFDIGSVTKQFTAYAIAQLEKNGKLSYNDDIRKHIPELNDFGHIITIDNLLFHSSGIRGSAILRGYIEGRLEVGKTVRHDQQLKLIYNQKELNFIPGTQQMYSNSGYILLGKIVENVTGMSLPEYLKKEVFEPLGMHSTQLPNSYLKIIPNRAEPYTRQEGKFIRTEGMLWEDYGHSGIYSTVQDLFKWQKHVHNQKYLLRVDPKTSSTIAMGLMLNKNSKGEIDEIFHFGSVPGYKSILRNYPKLNLDVITMSNLDNNRDLRAIESIKDIFSTKEESNEVHKTVKVPVDYLEQFESTYEIRGDKVLITLEGDHLIANTPMGIMKLIPIGRNEFSMEGTPNKILFDESLDFFTLKAQGGELKAPKIAVDKPEINYETAIDSFAGDYKSSELDIVNHISVTGGTLVVTTASNQKIELNRTGEYTFEGVKSYYYSKVYFEVDNGKVKAFRVTDEASWVQNLLFKKIAN